VEKAPANAEKIKELEEKIAELKRRWPAHSVKLEMVRELEELEEELAREKRHPRT